MQAHPDTGHCLPECGGIAPTEPQPGANSYSAKRTLWLNIYALSLRLEPFIRSLVSGNWGTSGMRLTNEYAATRVVFAEGGYANPYANNFT